MDFFSLFPFFKQMALMTNSFRLLQLSFNILKDFVSSKDSGISNSRSGIKKYCPSPRIIYNVPCPIYLVNPATINYLAALKDSSNNMPSSERDDSSTVDSDIVPHEMAIPPDKFWEEASLPKCEEAVFKQHIGKGREYLSIAIVIMLESSISLDADEELSTSREEITTLRSDGPSLWCMARLPK